MAAPGIKLPSPVEELEDPADTDIQQSMRQVQQRYCTIALVLTVAGGAALMAAGLPTYGKGLILGALFSIVNFIALAVLLPLQFNPGRKKSTMLSFISILLRYCLMAAPLIAAIKLAQFALSTVVVGLFIVQIAILGDQLWTRLHDSLGARL
jgi:ATP synthase protein I